MSSLKSFLVAQVSLSAILLAAVPAAAQSADAPQASAAPQDDQTAGADILVTARRRSERLQDIPISVNATSGADLQAKSIQNVQDLTNTTPNVSFGNAAGRGKGGSSLYIRGIGQYQTDVQFEPGVGVYQDGVYVGSMQGLNLDLLDTERVEILYGPQGTLFGMNTVGGAVSITSKRPTDKFEALGELTGGSYGYFEGRGWVNVPLNDAISTRIGVDVQKGGGYGRRLDFNSGRQIGSIGGKDRFSGRMMLAWQASDRLKATLAVDGMTADEPNAVHHLVNAFAATPLRTAFNNLLAANGLPLFDSRFTTSDPYTTYGTGLNTYKSHTVNGSATLEYDLGGAQLKSISAYRWLNVLSGNDFDGTPYQFIEQEVHWSTRQFTQELQLNGESLENKLHWTTGLYYLHMHANESQVQDFGVTLYQLGGPNIANRTVLDVVTKSYAAYGQATYAITDRLNFTGGVRYSKEDKDFTSPIGTYALFTNAQTKVPTGGSGSWGSVTGTASLDYHLSRNVMAYGSFGRGFKGGIPANPGPGQLQEVDPEYVNTYEVGLKTTILDGHGHLNGALYQSDYKDQQLYISQLNAAGQQASFVANAGSSRVRGAEVQGDVQPVHNLSLGATLGYTDARYLRLGSTVPTTGANAITLNTKFQQTPKYSASVSGDYTIETGRDSKLTGHVDYSYRSSVEYDVANNPYGHQAAYGLLGARLSFELTKAKLELSVFAKNLTDKRYLVAFLNVFPSFGSGDQQFGAPRTFGVSLRKSL